MYAKTYARNPQIYLKARALVLAYAIKHSIEMLTNSIIFLIIFFGFLLLLLYPLALYPFF